MTALQNGTFAKDSWDLQHIALHDFTQGTPEPPGVTYRDPETYAYWPAHDSVLYLYLPGLGLWAGYLKFGLQLISPSPSQKMSFWVADTYVVAHLQRRGLGQVLLEAAHRLAFQLRCVDVSGQLYEEGGRKLWNRHFGEQLYRTLADEQEHKLPLHQ